VAGILEDVRILDLTRLLPGPFCTQMLGDLGAEVIKIEEAGGGDYIRDYPPRGKSESGLFLSLNRNKKSVTLNLRSKEGRKVFMKLVSTADVVVEQFRPGVMERLGLGYEKLREINSQIIMCSISGYGQTGSYKNRAGHDINYLSVTGILDLIGNRQGGPVIPGIQVADVGGGSLWAAFSIMAALFARERTKQGQYIDISMVDTVFTYTVMLAGAYFMDKKVPRRGAELLNGGYAWYNVYKTKDQHYIAIGMLEKKFWTQFCQLVGREEFIDKQLAPEKVQWQMIADLEEIFANKSADEWMEILEPLDICATKVNNLAEAIDDVHLRERGMIVEIEHPVEGKVKGLGFPAKFSDTPYSLRLPPPVLGQHTEELLLELGYSNKEIVSLKTKGVI